MILSGNSLPKSLGLLLALPRIHLLFFANMTAVMEEMSMDKEEESLGPFFLEHFDNSEYTMAVPGEGVRHTSFLVSTVVLKDFLSDFSNSLQIDKVTKVGVIHPICSPGGSTMDGRLDLVHQHLRHLPAHL